MQYHIHVKYSATLRYAPDLLLLLRKRTIYAFIDRPAIVITLIIKEEPNYKTLYMIRQQDI